MKQVEIVEVNPSYERINDGICKLSEITKRASDEHLAEQVATAAEEKERLQ